MEYTLHNLIRLQQMQLDAKQLEISALEADIKEQHDMLVVIEDELVRETAFIETHPQFMDSFTLFAETASKRKRSIAANIEHLEEKTAHLREEMSDIFAERKRFEILLEQHQRKVIFEEKRQEASNIDEVSIQQFDRKQRTGCDS